MSRPAWGDAMEKAPHIHYTPPPGASAPPGYSPQPSATPAPSVRPSAAPTRAPGASPAPSGSPGATTGGRPGTGPGAEVQPGVPTPTPAASAKPTPRPPSYPNPEPSQTPGGAVLPSATPEPEETPNPNEKKVKVRADELVSDREHGITTFRGNVDVNYGDLNIKAEELSVDQKAQVIFTDTKFTFSQPDPKKPGERQIITGTGLRYHYDTNEAIVNGANLSTPAEYPGQTIYIRAKTIQAFGQSHFEASEATFTTCDYITEEKVPHYHVVSRSLQYFAGDKLIAWDNKVYINGHFVFWLPVWVIPLKQEQNPLNIGRNDIEGFYLRSGYNYSLPALNNGFWLNSGRLTTNLFEKKGVGLGIEHNITWGYEAATYAFLYGLITPDSNNLYPGNVTDPAAQKQYVAQNSALFGLYGGPFQDHQWGIEHKQRLPWDIELDGRYEDHNIYDPITPNTRTNRDSQRVEAKQTISQLGGLNYDISYDGTEQRGTSVPQNLAQGTQPVTLSQSVAQRLNGNMGFKIANTDVRLSSTDDRNQSNNRQTFAVQRGVLQAEGTPDVDYVTRTLPGAVTTNLNNTLSANSQWTDNTRSTLNVPYRVTINEAAPPAPPAPGESAAPASPTPTVTPSPWDQQAEPDLQVSQRLPDVGNLNLEVSKFLDLTRQATPLTPEQQQTRINALGKFDKLPELVFTSDPLFRDWQPVNLKLGYGRFFEYSSFKLPTGQATPLDINFPGEPINRLNPEVSLASKAIPIGFKSKLDFSGTGYRQFFYSTHDAQYSIDEHAQLTTDFTDKISTNFNYINNITPDPKKLPLGSPFVNNSPFQQDRLSLSKQTRLTGSFEVHNDPFLTYALRGGYDYQNLLYDNLSSEVTWRSRIFGLPFGLTLNGTYDLADTPYLQFEKKTLDIAYLPHIPTFGLAGMWQPVQGTFTLRSTEDVFGGAFGSNSILPGWQLDNSMAYDFNKGLWQSLINRLYITFGHDWRSHIELVLGGYYDTGNISSSEAPGYKFSTIGINKDLHDFVLSFQYDRLNSFYSLSLSMVAFPSQPLSFSSNTFNRTGSPGGAGFPGL